RITVRVPKTLHRDLAHAAEEEGVSLNLLISTALSHFSGSHVHRGHRESGYKSTSPVTPHPPLNRRERESSPESTRALRVVYRAPEEGRRNTPWAA
ncbi:MAG: toxin-antitoxin system HicB family antitoxin, partial [Chloroflexia bacterium]|nr:toxin-antitoxin system HicB family antitoxin [Chloroflexia bacterium]